MSPFTHGAHLKSAIAIFCALFVAPTVLAEPATVPFNDCFSGKDEQKLNVSTVYAQVVHNEEEDRHLNITVLGQAGQDIVGQAPESTSLATLFTNTQMLTLNVWNNRSYFCDTLRPASPPQTPSANETEYCHIPAGPFAFSSYIPLSNSHELTTLTTRLRAVDPFSNEILCLDVSVTPLKPGDMGDVYGHAIVVFWSSVALAISYWLVVGIARVVSAWGRGAARSGTGVWSKIEGAGYIFASALSGERFASSPALMRFCTPSMRDIFFHTQWCAALGMVAVQWPDFVYPLLAQTSWATLTYNITLTQEAGSRHWYPLHIEPYDPPANFRDQLNDPNSILYIDAAAPNTLFMLPEDTKTGIPAFAESMGLREQDLFGICLALFLALVGSALALSMLVHGLGWLGAAASKTRSPGRSGARSPGPRYTASASKDMLDSMGPINAPEEDRSQSGHFLFRGRVPVKGWKRRWLPSGLNSFHGNILHGNLVRLLILFHFPITIFSCHQMTLGREHATLLSIALAALSFAVLSVIIPVLLVFRLISTTTSKLYDETGTLLSLGPLYNHYRHGSQLFATTFFATNIAFGLTIGCGQKSGTAQAIVILVIEVASALGTSIWLPWGQGASMGLISFLFCVARIVIAVLLVILTPLVSIGQAASGWVTYAILFILGIVYLTFLILLIVKLVEAAVRVFGGVGFDRSRHVMDSGLIGACALLGGCGGRRRRSSKRRRHRSSMPLPPQEDSFSLPSTLHGKFSTPSPSPANTLGPPSVLRPEHAMRPYKEDSDDEGGYIMRAWQPFPHPGYAPVDEPPPQPKTGFARVGGGRAHYDSPYAIKGGQPSNLSSTTFPSMEYPPPHVRQPSNDEPLPTASLTNVARHPTTQQAQPTHYRTRSQTAVIERVPALAALQGHAPEISASTDAPDDADDSDVAETPRKKWFQLRPKGRRHSESLSKPLDDFEPPMPSEPGRSFMVVRKGGQATGRGDAAPSNADDGEEPLRRSFAVLRGPNAGG